QGEATLRSWVASTAVGCAVLPRPAGWTAILALPPGVHEDRFLMNALSEGVWAHPGYFYGMPTTTPSVVLSLLTPPEALSAGLRAFDRALKRS
ncbi:MAG: hypothetical protein RLZZ322_865, partial [Verrucomicrobiota bacterium]